MFDLRVAFVAALALCSLMAAATPFGDAKFSYYDDDDRVAVASQAKRYANNFAELSALKPRLGRSFSWSKHNADLLPSYAAAGDGYGKFARFSGNNFVRKSRLQDLKTLNFIKPRLGKRQLKVENEDAKNSPYDPYANPIAKFELQQEINSDLRKLYDETRERIPMEESRGKHMKSGRNENKLDDADIDNLLINDDYPEVWHDQS